MKLFKNIFKKQKPDMTGSSGNEPCLLKAHLLHENDIGVFKWDSKHNNHHLRDCSHTISDPSIVSGRTSPTLVSGPGGVMAKSF